MAVFRLLSHHRRYLSHCTVYDPGTLYLLFPISLVTTLSCHGNLLGVVEPHLGPTCINLFAYSFS